MAVKKLQVRDEFTGNVDEQVVRTPTELSVDLAMYLLLVSELMSCWPPLQQLYHVMCYCTCHDVMHSLHMS